MLLKRYTEPELRVSSRIQTLQSRCAKNRLSLQKSILQYSHTTRTYIHRKSLLHQHIKHKTTFESRYVKWIPRRLIFAFVFVPECLIHFVFIVCQISCRFLTQLPVSVYCLKTRRPLVLSLSAYQSRLMWNSVECFLKYHKRLSTCCDQLFQY